MGESELLSSPESREVKYMEAQCDGKTRAVTVMSLDAQFLKPLHKLLYDQISKYPWLLRGKAKPKSFASFKKKSGEVFVSGDYESATDHLPVSTAEWILRAAFKNARHIPEPVQVAALKYLRVDLLYPDGSRARATRQLMGSLLCFPLLCLQNYIAFRYIFGAEVPVKINGDDIVFRCAETEFTRWAQFVGSVGLRLSPGKTLVDPSTFSLNSTFFASSKNGVRLVPVVRCTSLMKAKCPYPNALAGTFKGFLEGFRGGLRDELGAWFLRKKKRLIRGCGRSVSRGLGLRVSEYMLKSSDLWLRELWYFNSVPVRYDRSFDKIIEGVELPRPPDRLEGQVSIPRGWRRVEVSKSPLERARQREAERDFWELLIDQTWGQEYRPREVEEAYWAAVKNGSFETEFFNWRVKNCSKPQLEFIKRIISSKPEYSRCDDGIIRPVFGPQKQPVVGLRSRLQSRPLWRQLTSAEGQKKQTVWVYVGDKDDVDEYDASGEAVRARFGELVRERLAIETAQVELFKYGYSFPTHPRGWMRLELAADSYVQ